MSKLVKYRIFCNTDSKYEFIWLESNDPVPTTCPTNTAHTIDDTKVKKVDERSDLKIQIQEESTSTGGHFRLDDYSFECLGNQTTYYTFSFPIDTSVLSFKVVVQPSMGSDIFGGIVGPDTIIGAVTAPVSTTDKTFTVSQTVIDNAFYGAVCNLTDGVNVDDVGEIIGIDSDNMTITVTEAPSNTYSPLSPTYVRIGVQMANNVKLPILTETGYLSVGQSKIGASYLPKNTITKVKYINNTSETKTCHVLYEYLY